MARATLIADSGSTKTHWLDTATGRTLATEGLNPHFTSDAHLDETLARVRAFFGPAAAVHFYGAGCGSAAQAARLERALLACFGEAAVSVGTDLLAACRAVAADAPSLVGILGTGSNACLFDGTRIAAQAVSTGYILGDHGSANHVGRMLLGAYLDGTMPDHIRTMFHDTYALGAEQFMDAVYHQPNANRFLASLAPFAASRMAQEPFCRDLVAQALGQWHAHQLLPLGHACRRISIVGGFGAAIEPFLRRSLAARGYEVMHVVADPLPRLALFHQHHHT